MDELVKFVKYLEKVFVFELVFGYPVIFHIDKISSFFNVTICKDRYTIEQLYYILQLKSILLRRIVFITTYSSCIVPVQSRTNLLRHSVKF